jgi:hypothetical protein
MKTASALQPQHCSFSIPGDALRAPLQATPSPCPVLNSTAARPRHPATPTPTPTMAELELEQARSFAFAVDAAFKEAQRGMCADATKQGECRALKAIRCGRRLACAAQSTKRSHLSQSSSVHTVGTTFGPWRARFGRPSGPPTRATRWVETEATACCWLLLRLPIAAAAAAAWLCHTKQLLMLSSVAWHGHVSAVSDADLPLALVLTPLLRRTTRAHRPSCPSRSTRSCSRCWTSARRTGTRCRRARCVDAGCGSLAEGRCSPTRRPPGADTPDGGCARCVLGRAGTAAGHPQLVRAARHQRPQVCVHANDGQAGRVKRSPPAVSRPVRATPPPCSAPTACCCRACRPAPNTAGCASSRLQPPRPRRCATLATVQALAPAQPRHASQATGPPPSSAPRSSKPAVQPTAAAASSHQA